MTDARGYLARCQLRLLEFHFGFIHRNGVKHQAADRLYHLPTTEVHESPLRDGLPVLTITNRDLEAKSNGIDSKNLYSLPWDEGADAIKSGPEVAQVSD